MSVPEDCYLSCGQGEENTKVVRGERKGGQGNEEVRGGRGRRVVRGEEEVRRQKERESGRGKGRGR